MLFSVEGKMKNVWTIFGFIQGIGWNGMERRISGNNF